MTAMPALNLLKRQRALLGLLHELGGQCARLDFQKLLFLYCQEAGRSAPYTFVPYRFGAFSFSSYADRRNLEAKGLLDSQTQDWTLTEAGQRAALEGSEYLAPMRAFVQRWRSLSGEALIAETYRHFPYYATRSEIAARVLAREPDALTRVDEARPVPGTPGLVTIGYESRSLETYLNLLLMDGVTVLCDVRRNPLSRKYGFSKRTLASSCAAVGTRYEHLPQLGIASEARQNLRTSKDYDALFETYRRDYLPQQGKALGVIRDWIAEGERVALTCFELRPEQCHRACVAEAMEQQFGDCCSSKDL